MEWGKIIKEYRNMYVFLSIVCICLLKLLINIVEIYNVRIWNGGSKINVMYWWWFLFYIIEELYRICRLLKIYVWLEIIRGVSNNNNFVIDRKIFFFFLIGRSGMRLMFCWLGLDNKFVFLLDYSVRYV